MNTQEINEIVTFLTGSSEELKLVFKKIVKVIDEFSEELKPQIDRLQDYSVDQRTRMVKRFEKNGFTTDQSIALTNSLVSDIAKNINKKK